MDISHRVEPGPASEGGLGESRAITLRGPAAWLLVAVVAAPWAVGMYVIVRAVMAYLSRPAQRVGPPPPPRFAQRAAAYRRWEEE